MTEAEPSPASQPPEPRAELDPVIHAQARLRVVVALSVLHPGDRLAFPRLQELLGMTAGNLSIHLRKLGEAGYVEVVKTHQGRTPTTLLALTRRGRLAFEEYTAAIQLLLQPPDLSSKETS
jgi:DNA-binding MarR family transcriptional regulator